MNKLSLQEALRAVPLMAAAIFATRLFSFALFSKKEPPSLFQYAGKHLPPLVMAALIVYSLKTVNFAVFPYGLAEMAACTFTLIVHLWKGNAMISIFGGTLIYMLLQ